MLDEGNLYNPYAGMGNNPVGNVDPMGLFTMEGMYEAFFKEYGQEGLGLLMWAAAQGLQFKKRSYWSHDWYYEGGNVIGIKATNMGFERSDENAAEQLHEAIMAMYTERVTERKIAANFRDTYGEAGGASFWLYYVGREVGFTYTTEAIAGGDAAGNDWTGGQRWLAGSVGLVQSVLTLAPAGAGIGKGLTTGASKVVGGRFAGKVAASWIGRLLARDVTFGAGQLIRRQLLRSIGRTLNTRIGAAASGAFRKAFGRIGRKLGSFKGMKQHELDLVEELVGSGAIVEGIPRSGAKTADVFINGVRTEIKRATTWRAVKNRLQDAAKQVTRWGDEVLIDARTIEGATRSKVMTQIARATGNRAVLANRTITVLFQNGTLVRTGAKWLWVPISVGTGQSVNATTKGN